MGVTRSWDARIAVRLNVVKPPVSPERQRELLWLIGASILVACGLSLVYAAKTRDFMKLEDALRRGDVLNLNAASSPAHLAPFLQIVPPAEQQPLAEKLWAYLERARPLANVGALSRAHANLPLARVKPLLVVRTPQQFRLRFAEWIAV